MPDFYEALGVQRTATSGQIREAWRKATSKAHPDRGGSVDEQALLNEAYRVLFDPELRRNYDETGRSQLAPTLDDQAKNALLMIINMALDSPEETLPCCRKILASQLDGIPQKIDALRQQRATIERRLGTVTVSTGENLIEMSMSKKLRDVAENIEKCEAQLRVMERASEMLDMYAAETLPERFFVSYTVGV